jgi:hypothetical protein
MKKSIIHRLYVQDTYCTVLYGIGPFILYAICKETQALGNHHHMKKKVSATRCTYGTPIVLYYTLWYYAVCKETQALGNHHHMGHSSEAWRLLGDA